VARERTACTSCKHMHAWRHARTRIPPDRAISARIPHAWACHIATDAFSLVHRMGSLPSLKLARSANTKARSLAGTIALAEMALAANM
jgi:hypothetical protein